MVFQKCAERVAILLCRRKSSWPLESMEQLRYPCLITKNCDPAHCLQLFDSRVYIVQPLNKLLHLQTISRGWTVSATQLTNAG